MHNQMLPPTPIPPHRRRDRSSASPLIPSRLAKSTNLVRRSQELSSSGVGSDLINSAVKVADLAVGREDGVVEEVADAALDEGDVQLWCEF